MSELWDVLVAHFSLIIFPQSLLNVCTAHVRLFGAFPDLFELWWFFNFFSPLFLFFFFSTGGNGHEHEINWFSLKENRKTLCVLCGQFFLLQKVLPSFFLFFSIMFVHASIVCIFLCRPETLLPTHTPIKLLIKGKNKIPKKKRNKKRWGEIVSTRLKVCSFC